jgi:hypothetical protein
MQNSESSYFSTKPGDFLIFCFFGMVIFWIYSLFYPLIFLGSSLTSYCLYYSTKRAPDFGVMLFLFPIFLGAPYIPLLLLAINIITDDREAIIRTLVGYGAAHLYFFLQDVIGERFDLNLLKAPEWMNDSLYSLLQQWN